MTYPRSMSVSLASTPYYHVVGRCVRRGFQDQAPASQPSIPFALHEYLELIDWSSRIVRPDKRGAVDSKVPPILQRLHIDRDAWQKLLRPGANRFGRAIGTLDRLAQYAKAVGRQYLRGQRYAEVLYGSG
jgi:hypothetical protein